MFIPSIEKHLTECRIKDLQYIASVLSKLNFKKENNETFVKKFIEAGNFYDRTYIEKNPKILLNEGINFIFYNVYLANMDIYCSKYINSIFEAVNNSKELESSETLNEILRSGLKVISRITASDAFHMQDEDLEKFVEEHMDYAGLLQGALSKIFVLDCMIEILRPIYKGARLKKSVGQKLAKLVFRQKEHGVDHVLMNDVLFNTCSILNIRNRDGYDRYLYRGFLSPETSTQDIAFCVDVESSKPNLIMVLPLPTKYKQALDLGIDIVRPGEYSNFDEHCSNESLKNKFKWFAICAPQNKFQIQRTESGARYLKTELNVSGQLSLKYVGPFHIRIKKLEALGYTVIPLTYEILNKCRDHKSTIDIRKLLNKYCTLSSL